MTDLVKRSTRQLALPLESALLQPDMVEQIRNEVVAALADLLLEAMGEECQGPADEQGVSDEL
jgi:hypothetical protein